MDIRFRARFATDGELRFLVYPIPLTRETSRLDLAWFDTRSTKAPRFGIKATSACGMRFESDEVIISNRGTKTTPTRAHIVLGLRYTRATLSQLNHHEAAPPKVRWALRGFECFPPISATCLLGEISMDGAYPRAKDDRVSGSLVLRALEMPADVGAWRAEAERLFDHIRDYMSFALSHPLKAPIQDTWIGGCWERSAVSQTKSRRNAQHVLHPMRLQAYLDAVVEAFFAPKLVANDLGYALEWFAMDATYNEMRLLNVSTALENLTASNLPEADLLFLEPKTFKPLAKSVRRHAAAELDAMVTGAGQVDRTIADALIASMPGKVQDLNRRPLFDRVMALALRWAVPLDGLPIEAIREAITARNNVVHRGYFPGPKAGSVEQRDLWDHVLIMREVVIRVVLTVLDFKGTYLSFRGGEQDVLFPPVVEPEAGHEGPKAGS